MIRVKHTLITIIIISTITALALLVRRPGCNFWELLGRFICATLVTLRGMFAPGPLVATGEVREKEPQMCK